MLSFVFCTDMRCWIHGLTVQTLSRYAFWTKLQKATPVHKASWRDFVCLMRARLRQWKVSDTFRCSELHACDADVIIGFNLAWKVKLRQQLKLVSSQISSADKPTLVSGQDSSRACRQSELSQHSSAVKAHQQPTLSIFSIHQPAVLMHFPP